jgi:hypothetical protein
VLGVLVSDSLLQKLQAALEDTSGVYINAGVDEHSYLSALASDILANLCKPFPLSATVMPPGFPDAPLGSTITGQCLAHKSGYWLVYQPEQDRFYCFWGTDQGSLGAHGVFGSPLYCWSA